MDRNGAAQPQDHRCTPEYSGDVMTQRDQSTSTLSILFFFDVLGFSERVSELGLDTIYTEYTRLLSLVEKRNGPAAMSGYAPADFTGDPEKYFANRDTEIKWAPIATVGDLSTYCFSDTILLWCSYRPLVAGLVIDVAIDFFCQCLHAGIPLRGAASIGELVMDQERGIFLGKPIVEAARAESAQRWCGFSLGPSFREYPMLCPANRILPFEAHIKAGCDAHVLDIGVDWTWHWRKLFSETPLPSFIERYRRTGYEAYWDNTLAFDALAAAEDWRASTLPIFSHG